VLRLRLVRVGRKGQPHYRVVVAEHSRPVKGKFVEKLGSYNPHNKELAVDADRVKYWISVGAQPTSTLARLFKENKLEGMDKYIKFVTFKKKPESEEAAAAAPEAASEAPAPAADAAPAGEEKPAEEAAPAPEAPAEEKKEEEAPAA